MTLIKPHYTQVPNVLFECMTEMTDAELRVTLAIVRKIVGFHKDGPEPVSYSKLQELTGLSRQGVRNGIERAIKRGYVKIHSQGKRHVNLFTLNFSDQSTELTSQLVDQSTTLTSTSLPSRPELGNEVDQSTGVLKETSKETSKDIASASKNDADARAPKKKAKTRTAPSKPRARNPHYDMVATEWFEKRMNTPEFAALGSRIGLHAAWLSGKAITVKRRNEDTGEREVHEIPGCQYEVTPALLKAAKKAWAVEYPKASPPHDILKFVAFVGGWLTKHHAQQEAAAVKPIPNCAVCGGTGLILPALGAYEDGDPRANTPIQCPACAKAGRASEAQREAVGS